MANQILAIAPYWLDELATWVFDGPKVDLSQEPSVSGVPEMIDFLVKDIPSPIFDTSRAGLPILFWRAKDLCRFGAKEAETVVPQECPNAD